MKYQLSSDLNTAHNHLKQKELERYDAVIEEHDASFEALASLAATLCNVPIAGISVVDDEKVWIKAHFGIEACWLPREGAFCAVAVDENEDLFVIEDTTIDMRFFNNPLVTDAPNIRYYAASPFRGENGFAVGTVWIMDTKPTSITQETAQVLQSLAKYVVQSVDNQYSCDVTKLPNREGFSRRLKTLIQSDSGTVSLCNLQIQQIHNVCTLYGNETANLLIQTISHRLLEWLPGNQPLGHFGLGNFCFWQTEEQSTRDLDALLTYISRPVLIDGLTFAVIANIGVARTSDGTITPQALINMAELAVNENNRCGLSSVCYQSGNAFKTQLTKDLRHAIYHEAMENSIEPHYQPQININTGELFGFESLLRWENPSYQKINIGQIFTAIESLGLIPSVDYLMFRKVCSHIRVWLDSGLIPPKISINVSRVTLQDAALVSTFIGILAEFGLSTDHVLLEITETGFQVNEQGSAERLRELHRAGFHLAIDDFGKGNSNIDSLKKISCELLKVDRQFVHGVSINPTTEALMRLIKGTADAHNMQLLCEGVETQQDLDWLRNMGISLIQGWYFSKARPFKDVTTILTFIREFAPQDAKELRSFLSRVSSNKYIK
ncbi:GGDEF domain-containing phosphodiesterase [Parasalinivibrio latis]|uniref:sensor domain-containing diguanylate cyclase n=1 Tax=Parasalinivibrio latis TaxID=2952610 RepID=UPI0030E169CE